MQDDSAGKTNWGRIALLGFGGVLFFVIVAVVGSDAREYYVDYKMESQCDAGDWDSCGTVALGLLRDGTKYEEMTRGMQLMEEVCDRDYDGACRLVATFQGRRRPTFGGTTVGVLWDHRDPLLRDACLEGKPKACFAAAHAAQYERYDAETIAKLAAKSNDLCAANGDLHSCRAASLLGQLASTASKDAHRKACALGFANSCHSMRADRAVSALAPEEQKALRKGCEATGAPLACAPLAEADAALYRDLCWNAEWSYCGSVKLPEGAENSEAKAAFYDSVSRLTAGDVVGYSIGPVAPDLAEVCDAGVAEACFLAGADLVDELHEEWNPEDRPDLASLEATFGKACELGMNAGCLAIGTELSNRPPDRRDVATANEWLDKGCANGNVFSCWVRNYEAELRADKNERVAEASLRACKYDTRPGSACAFYVATLEHELGATPWVMSDRRMAALNLPLCWEARLPKACRDRGWAWDLLERPTYSELPGGLVFAAYADVENGCRMKNVASCYMMFDAARTRWPVPDDERAAELRQRVCDKIPGACRR